MGKMVKGVCKCGYESATLHLGSGFSGPDPSWVPVVCKQCGVLSTVNLYLRRGDRFIERSAGPMCRKCKTRKSLLSDPSLHTAVNAAKPMEEEFPWERDADDERHKDHPETLYFCPQCKAIKMRLMSCGMWD